MSPDQIKENHEKAKAGLLLIRAAFEALKDAGFKATMRSDYNDIWFIDIRNPDGSTLK